jgi:hypothetical protein
MMIAYLANDSWSKLLTAMLKPEIGGERVTRPK